MENVHRLEGSSGGLGGLVIKKKSSEAKENSSFKAPQASILGLDKLASIKKVQQVSQLNISNIKSW